MVKQIAVGGFDNNFSYIIADEKTCEAAVVDSSGGVRIILDCLNKLNLSLRYIINTHSHLDHIAGNKELVKITKAKVISHKLEKEIAGADFVVDDGDVIKVGNLEIGIIHTPGHTSGSICLLVEDSLITGDTLFVGHCGRTDGPGGSSEALYESLFEKLLKLPEETKVYPGHDYGKKPFSTLGEEKRSNPYLLCRSKKEFIELRKRGI